MVPLDQKIGTGEPAAAGRIVGILGWRELFSSLRCWRRAGRPLIVIARYVAEPPRRRARELDIVGVGFFGVGLPGVIYGMSATQNGLTSPQAWIPLSAPG